MYKNIYEVRGVKVMLDYQLAALYGVTTKHLNQAVKRNIERFPPHFMFQLTNEESTSMRSQIVTTSELSTRKYTRNDIYPYVFTEHGILMLSSVLRSQQAVQISIALVDVFVQLRSQLTSPLLSRVEKLEKEAVLVRKLFDEIFESLDQVQPIVSPSKRRIGLK